MNKRLLMITMSVLFVLMSCNNKSHYAFDVKEIDFVNKTGDVIEGKELEVGVFGINNILICDSLLLVITQDPNGLLKVLSIDDFKLLGNLCLEGNARNEFFFLNFLSGQWYYDKKGDLILPIIDDEDILKEINISQSVREQSTVILPYVSECISIMLADFVLIDNDVNKRFQCYRSHKDEVVSGKYYVPKYNIAESGYVVREIEVFPKLMKLVSEGNSMNMYYGKLKKHPSKNIILQPMNFLDYILRFDLNNNDFSAIHQKGSLSFDDIIPSLTLNTRASFSASCITSDYLFVLYRAGEYTRSFSGNNDDCPELYVFDWDCNYLGGVKLGNKIRDIAYDEKHQRLIGLQRGEDILYSFDLSELISSIEK